MRTGQEDKTTQDMATGRDVEETQPRKNCLGKWRGRRARQDKLRGWL